MHESSLARHILSLVLDRARRERAVAVRGVTGWIAETEALSAESVAFHFAALAAGTIAAGAHVELDVRRVEARCRSCGVIYRPDHHVVLCPACGSGDAELLGDTGLGIETIDVAIEGGESCA
jgi:hydrogenase nickel incorporation protein HypA/HybF